MPNSGGGCTEERPANAEVYLLIKDLLNESSDPAWHRKITRLTNAIADLEPSHDEGAAPSGPNGSDRPGAAGEPVAKSSSRTDEA